MADVDIKVTGADQLRRLGIDLRAAGSPAVGLRRELLASMRVLGKPLADTAKASAQEMLPKTGGLNEWVAGSKFAVRNRLVGPTVGMKITSALGAANLERIDDGNVRHPVYGDRTKWVSQTVPSGWFSEPLLKAAPWVQEGVTLAISVIQRRLESGSF